MNKTMATGDGETFRDGGTGKKESLEGQRERTSWRGLRTDRDEQSRRREYTRTKKCVKMRH